MKQNNYYRNAKRFMGEAKDTSKIIGDKKKAEFEKKLPGIKAARKEAQEKKQDFLLKAWDQLAPGWSLSCFGLHNIIVMKKNKKSITDTNGEKLTQHELFNMTMPY